MKKVGKHEKRPKHYAEKVKKEKTKIVKNIKYSNVETSIINKKKIFLIILMILAITVMPITLSKYISTINNIITLNITKPIYYIHYYNDTSQVGTQELKYGTSENLDKSNLTKEGYSFAGWNTRADGSGTSYDDEEEVLNLSSTNGAVITLYAMWELETGIPYTVIHKQMNLDGTTYSVVETETKYGEANGIADPLTKTYTGFTSPERQFTRIKADGSTEITYEYTRNKYILEIENFDLIDESVSTSPGEYYYGTPITVSWKGHLGCTFIKWNNEDTNQMLNFLLQDDTTIKPIFDYVYGVFVPYDGSSSTLMGISVTKTDITSFGRNDDLTLAEVLAKPGVQEIQNDLDDGNKSDTKVYGWVENNKFYWWSDAYLVYFHPDTINAFDTYSSITTIDLVRTSTERVENFSNWFCSNRLLTDIYGIINTSGVVLEPAGSFNYQATNNDLRSNRGMSFMFNDCNALKSIDLSEFDTSNVDDMKRMFAGCNSLKTLDVSGFDTSNVKSFYWMFRKTELADLDLSNFDTSNVITMFGMFVQATKLKTVKFGENFDTTNTYTTENMFYADNQLKTIYVRANPDTSGITRSQNMFSNCTSLVGEAGEPYATPFNSSKINKEYARIAEEGVPGYFTCYETDKYNITYNLNGGTANNRTTYYETSESFTLEAPTKTGYTFLGWTGSNGNDPELQVTISTGSTGDKTFTANFVPNIYTVVFDANGGTGTMSNQTFIYDEEQRLTPNAFTKTDYTFRKWTTGADGSGTAYNNEQALLNELTEGTLTLYAQYINENLVGYFRSYDGSVDGILGFSKTDITSFERKEGLTKEEVLAKSGVQLISNTAQDGYESPTEVYGWVENNVIYWWSEANVVYFHPDTVRAFEQCSKITKIDLTGTSTERVKNFAAWFNFDSLLTQIIGKINTSGVEEIYNNSHNYTAYDGDANNNSCSYVGMAFMFNDCKVLQSIDLSEFDTKNVTDMKRMFAGCKLVTTLDLSRFDTSKVKSFYWMFRNDENLTSIDLSSFDSSNVVNMYGMFNSAKKATTITFGPDFDTSNVVTMNYMFYQNQKLTTIYAESDFVVAQGTTSSSMFLGDTLLVGGAGTAYQTNYSSSYINAARAKIAGQDKPGYFTQK